jgi:hypothetical protein
VQTAWNQCERRFLRVVMTAVRRTTLIKPAVGVLVTGVPRNAPLVRAERDHYELGTAASASISHNTPGTAKPLTIATDRAGGLGRCPQTSTKAAKPSCTGVPSLTKIDHRPT